MNGLNYLLLLALIAYNCFANTPISLNVSGTRGTISSLTPPQRQYIASLEGATAESYEWTIFGDVDSGSNGNTATITFTGNAPDDGSLPSATIKCKAKYRDADNNLKTIESDKINVEWFCGHLSTRIEGESIVLRDSEHTYTAKIDTNLYGSKTYSWTWYENGVKKTSQNENITINFQDITGNSLTLNCKAGVGDTQLDASPFVIDISDDNYILTASRKDYKINDQHEHYRTYTDDNAVYIHFNVDDDDFSATGNSENKYGCDFEQIYFKDNCTTKDDDLCKILFNVEVKNGQQIDFSCQPITITKSSSLRLWKTQDRKNGDLLITNGNFKTWSNANEILGKPLYIEGISHDSEGSVKVQLGSKTRNLLYKTCSVGDKENQPTMEEKKFIKSKFPKLIDCEWGILRRGTDFYYNCIAFSADPYLQTFKNVDYDNRFIRDCCMYLPKHKIENAYPFFVEKASSTNVYIPTENEDYFYVELTMHVNEEQRDCFKKYMNNTNISLFSYPYKFREKKYLDGMYDVILTSNNKDFKEESPNVIYSFFNSFPCKIVYLIYMNNFGNVFEANQLKDANIDAFFQSDLWKENNHNYSFAKCDKTDKDRNIVYYSKFHAARRASLLKKAEYNSPKNCPADWIVFASKIGNCEVILHLEEQLAGFEKEEYGTIKHAYK